MFSQSDLTNPYAKIMHAAKWRIIHRMIFVVALSLGCVFLFNGLAGTSITQINLLSMLMILAITIASAWFFLGATLDKMGEVVSKKQRLIREINASLKLRVRDRTAELESTSKELEKSLRVKSEFLATMSHEIRTPMNGVLGMSQLLNETELTERQRRYVSIVNASGKSLLDVLNNVLDFSKIEAGKMEVENIPFDLENLIDECISVFALKALEKKVILFGGLATQVPRICKGDPTRLRQILMNLLSNAVKFTFDGEVSLRVHAEDIADDNASKINLMIEVMDNGIGIAQSQQATLFEAFSQTDSSTTRKYGGTGLGLVICKQLVQLMGGKITVQSALGSGTTFTIVLQVDALSTQDAQAYRADDPSLDKANVLVVDTPQASLLLEQQLMHWGASVTRTNSFEQACALLDSNEGREINQIIASMTLEDGNAVDFIYDTMKRFPQRVFQAMIITPISLESMDAPAGIFKLLERPVTSSMLQNAVVSALESAPTSSAGIVDAPVRQNFSDIRALIAEDNLVNQLVIKGILKKFNISPVVVEDGASAVEALNTENNAFDLVLMDCEMPVMDGWEATEQIRLNEQQEDVGTPVKIVALSAHVIAEPRERALASGMDQFVAKPVNIDSVESILHEYFPRSNANDEIQIKQ